MREPVDQSPNAQRETDRRKDLPCVAMGVDFWRPPIELAEQSMLATGTLSREEIELELTADSEAAVESIQGRLAKATMDPAPPRVTPT